MEKVLVAGATGTTGNIIVNLLTRSENYEPVAMVRGEDQLAAFREKGIKAILGDLSEDVSHVTRDMDKVIFAAGSKGNDVEGIDKKGAMKLIDASVKDQITKFVMLSSMGTKDPSAHPELEDYLKAKKNADEYLIKSELPYSIIRPGALNNDSGKGKIALDAYLERKGEISREDVAKTLFTALDDHLALRSAFEILEGDQPIAEALENISF